MPRIDAPTVAEHHRMRRAALLRAAENLLAEGGIDAVTLGAVGSGAGLARSSVYQYFDSAHALVVALVEDLMDCSLQRLSADTSAPLHPQSRIDAFIRSALRTSTEPTHQALSALSRAALPPECSARLAELHDDQQGPLRRALADLGLPDPGLSAELVMGLVQAGTKVVLQGGALDDVTSRTLAIVHGGLTGTDPVPDPALESDHQGVTA